MVIGVACRSRHATQEIAHLGITSTRIVPTPDASGSSALPTIVPNAASTLAVTIPANAISNSPAAPRAGKPQRHAT